MPDYIDLTLVYGADRWSQPFLFESPTIKPIHNHEDHGRSNTFFSSPCHLGTHIDAPYHFIETGARITELDVSLFIGDAVMLDLRHCPGGDVRISDNDLEAAAAGRDLTDRIVVLHTGWVDRAFGRDGRDYYGPEHPSFSTDAAKWLVGQAPRSVVVDTLVDVVEPPRHGDNPVHRTILGEGIPIIENVRNLELLPPDGFRIIALPLALEGADGAPARVVAEI